MPEQEERDRIAELERERDEARRELDSAHELNAEVARNYRAVVRELAEARADRDAALDAEDELNRLNRILSERITAARREALEQAAFRFVSSGDRMLHPTQVAEALRGLAAAPAPEAKA